MLFSAVPVLGLIACLSLTVTSQQFYDPQLFLENGCPRPDAIKHGNFLLAPGHDRVHYICDEGYIAVGYMYASCTSKKWSQPAPLCVASGCKTLESMRHGYIQLSYGGAIARFRCDTGYDMKGPEVIVCDGYQWNGTQPECIDPLAYKRGKEKTDFYLKSNVVNQQYRKYGEDLPKSHEQWLEEADYSCIEKIEVVSPPVVLHASPFTKWILVDGRPRLYTIYRCQWGFIPVGDNQNLYCQNKRWVGPRPKCVSMARSVDSYIHFQGEEPKPDSFSPHKDWVAYSDYSCMTEGHHVTAPGIMHAQTLARSTSLDGLPHLFVEYVCEDGYQLQNPDKKYMYCHKEAWLGDAPVCLPQPYQFKDIQQTKDSEVSCDESKCEQMCTIHQGKATCGCKHGYQLNPDGFTCLDIDECAQKNGGCHHACVNTAGSYECKCHNGYHLLPDMHTCRPSKRLRTGHQQRNNRRQRIYFRQ